MEEAFAWIFYETTRFPLQLFFSSLIFFPLLKRRKYFWIKAMLFSVTMFLIPVLWVNYVFDLAIPNTWFSFTYLLIFIINQIFLFLLFDTSIMKTLFVGASGYVIQNLMFQSHTLIINLTFPNNPSYNATGLIPCIIKFSVETVILVITFLYIRHWQDSIIKRLDNKTALYFSTICILLVSVLSNYIMSAFDWSLSSSLLSIIICLLLMLVHLGLFQNEKLELDKEVVDKMVYLSSKQQDEVKRNIDSINIKCHDLKHQIKDFRERTSLNDREQKYLVDLEHDIQIYDSRIVTGNDALNIVLTEKSFTAEQDKINFTVMCDGKLISFMESNDIYSLFGNILDNAIEAERKIEPEYRSISLRIFAKGNAVSIHAENYYAENINFNKGLPQTSKADKENHGFGLLSIKRIVEKYSGIINFNQKNDHFIINILFVNNEPEV